MSDSTYHVGWMLVRCQWSLPDQGRGSQVEQSQYGSGSFHYCCTHRCRYSYNLTPSGWPLADIVGSHTSVATKLKSQVHVISLLTPDINVYLQLKTEKKKKKFLKCYLQI